MRRTKERRKEAPYSPGDKTWLRIRSPELGESCPTIDRYAEISFILEAVWFGRNPRLFASWPPTADVKLGKALAAPGNQIRQIARERKKLRLFAIAST